ncbi:hypothetical protein FHS77_003306 [Paenochrobactrum gallinarii]|uniref:DUF4424 domain-containing protein n=1 Tax=Paenochrobactrum gallinarii TaxID=643673 RepID=A0A841M9B6_9HYPH|nr:hypothetical protein [Paenochrobactrum gallinarii]
MFVALTNDKLTISYEYKPANSVSLYTGEQDDLKAIIAGYGNPYCLDKSGIAGVKRLLERVHSANISKGEDSLVFAVETEYVFKTGSNKAKEIGIFKMTLDKLHPDAVLSTCFKGLRKINHTQFEAQKSNFMPVESIRFIVFQQSTEG